MSLGGTSEIHDATEEVQSLVDGVRSDLEAKTGRTFSQYKAVSYITQVVAGTNYFVKVQVGDNDFVHVRIFKPLPQADKQPELSEYQVDKTQDDVLEYF